MGSAPSIALVLTGSFLAVLTLFSSMHLWLVLKARTTLESQLLGGTGREYDFGAYENWILVFGASPWGWIYPRNTPDVDRATLWGTQWKRRLNEAGVPVASEYPTKKEVLSSAVGNAQGASLDDVKLTVHVHQ